MGNNALSVMVAAGLLASVGVAHAKGPVTLTDGQLDKVTAGASETPSQIESVLVADSTTELNRLLTISSFAVGFLNGVTLTPNVSTLTPLPVTP